MGVWDGLHCSVLQRTFGPYENHSCSNIFQQINTATIAELTRYCGMIVILIYEVTQYTLMFRHYFCNN